VHILRHHIICFLNFPTQKIQTQYPKLETETFVFVVKRIDWDNLNWEKNYSRFQGYALSKLENVLFTVELHRRLRARGLNISTFAVHPGVGSPH
jgi:NAD(P)-dependent dehydrogenase (short-subunit alcohol dehydrogenase family)